MDRYSVSRTKRSLFYLMMAFLIVGFIIAECILPSERSQSVSDNNITYEGSFTWEKSDGEREAIEVPGRYDVKPGDTMVITTVLPDDFNANVMAIRASLQTVREQSMIQRTRDPSVRIPRADMYFAICRRMMPAKSCALS